MGEAILINHYPKKNTGDKYYDTLTAIGAKETVNGAAYNEAGYFGTVPASELFTGTQLASLVGITQGTVQHNNTEWLKFYLDGKILFTPLKPIRYSISWSALNSANCIFGDKVITKGDLKFKIRLFSGSTVDPMALSAEPSTANYSEWNRLILPIHEFAKTKVWNKPTYVENDLPDWNIGFTDADLITNSTSGTGSYSWCQESISGSSAGKFYRGRNDASFGANASGTTTLDPVGWRPVLEVVPN